MSLGGFLAGAGFFALVYGALAYASLRITRRWLGHLDGAARALAAWMVFLALLVGVHMVAGLTAVLSRWSVAALALAVAAAASRIDSPERQRHGAAKARLRNLGFAAATALGALGVCAAAATWRGSATPSNGADTVGFHLPGIAAWIQRGSLWHVDQFGPVWAIGNYPQNGDVFFLSGVLPWHEDAFAQLLNVPLLALAGLAVYTLAGVLGAPSRAAALCAALFCSVPVLAVVAYGGTMPDVFLAASFGAGVTFLVRSFRNGRGAELVLAGICLGLAFGAKWNGVYVVAIAVAVWAAAWLIARRPVRSLLVRAAGLVGLVVAGGGFWLLRNLILAGNPVIPVKVQAFGTTIFDAPPDEVRACAGFRVADYLGSPDIWRHYLIPQYRDWQGAPGAALGVGLLAAAVFAALALRRRRAAGDGGPAAVLAVSAVTAMIVVAYLVTPFSALGVRDQPVLVGLQSRYLLPALVLAAAVTAWAVGRLGQRARVAAELALLGAVLLGLRRGMAEVPHVSLAGTALAGMAVAVAVIAAKGRLQLSPGARVATGALALVAILAVGHQRQRQFDEHRYLGVEPAIDWIVRHAPSGNRIALAGSSPPTRLLPVLPAFGPRLENEVGFPARVEQTVLRPYLDQASWAAAVRRGRYDFVLASSGGYDPLTCAPVAAARSADTWAHAAGFERVAGGQPLSLYRVNR